MKTRPAIQERLETQFLEDQVAHQATGMFIVNTNSLHNYQAIRLVVPTHLWGFSMDLGDTALIKKQAAQQIRRDKRKAATAKENGEGASENDEPAGSDAMEVDSPEELPIPAFSQLKKSRSTQKAPRCRQKSAPKKSRGAACSPEDDYSNPLPESEEEHEGY